MFRCVSENQLAILKPKVMARRDSVSAPNHRRVFEFPRPAFEHLGQALKISAISDDACWMSNAARCRPRRSRSGVVEPAGM